jgi:hypothetical protein
MAQIAGQERGYCLQDAFMQAQCEASAECHTFHLSTVKSVTIISRITATRTELELSRRQELFKSHALTCGRDKLESFTYTAQLLWFAVFLLLRING